MLKCLILMLCLTEIPVYLCYIAAWRGEAEKEAEQHINEVEMGCLLFGVFYFWRDVHYL